MAGPDHHYSKLEYIYPEIKLEDIINPKDLQLNAWAHYELPVELYAMPTVSGKFHCFTPEDLESVYDEAENEDVRPKNPYTRENLPVRENGEIIPEELTEFRKRFIPKVSAATTSRAIQRLVERNAVLQRTVNELLVDKYDMEQRENVIFAQLTMFKLREIIARREIRFLKHRVEELLESRSDSSPEESSERRQRNNYNRGRPLNRRSSNRSRPAMRRNSNRDRNDNSYAPRRVACNVCHKTFKTRRSRDQHYEAKHAPRRH